MHTCCTCLLLNVTSIHSPSIYPSISRHLLISGLFMHPTTVLWAWICVPATHFLGARILPQHCLPSLCKCPVLPIPLSTGPYLNASLTACSRPYSLVRKGGGGGGGGGGRGSMHPRKSISLSYLCQFYT